MRRSTTRQHGFTAIELMVVVFIVAIITAAAAPSMSAMIRTQRLRTATFDLFSALNLARSEAIKRNRDVTVAPTAGSWSSGWSVTDSAGNVVQRQSGWDTLTMTGPSNVVFASSGRATSGASFNVSSTGVDASKFRCVTLDLSGRAVSKEGAC